MAAHAVPFFSGCPGAEVGGAPSTGGRFGSLAAQRNSTGVPCEARKAIANMSCGMPTVNE